MDMEVIQEFSENQCYLNALSHSNFVTELEVKVDPVDNATIEKERLIENLDRVLTEPIGKLLFRAYLRKTYCLDSLLFLDSVEEYDSLPLSTFRERFAIKIIRQFLDDSPNTKQAVTIPRPMLQAITTRLASDGPVDDLFTAAKQSVLIALRLSGFHAFLHSKYYSRLLSFRAKEAQPINRNSFTFIRVLGEGGFGKVFAVSKNDTRALYACKTMSKEKIIARKRERLILNERDILSKVYHPFIVTLSYAFQDEENLYLVLNLMSGGELAFHLARATRFTERMVRFYAAGIVLALEYFHSQGIVYRDLKPENIMLDADGYIRVTDLGLCSFVKPNERLHQHCGTRSYMAPEQCYGEDGYGMAVDWWALGVTIFHLMTGVNPFSRRYRHRRKSQPEDGDNKDKPAGEKEPSAKQPQDVPSPPAPASPVTNARGSLVADEPSALRHPGLAAVAAEMRDPVSAVSAVGARGSVLTDDKVSQIRPASGTIGKGASTTTKGGLVSRIKSTRTFGWGFGKNEEEKVGGDVQPPHETPEARAERYAQLRKQYEETLADFPYPERMSRRARSICEQLLQMDPSKRLGARGAQEVKSHPFFEGISWHQLKERHITPPFIPERDYVNAKFLEAAAGAFSSKPKKNQKAVNFQNFDFIRPAVFQEEVMQSIHDKDALVGPD